ncbi:protein-export membrane protein SecF [Thermococcus onnurineus NA1]|uniref:Protein-export membrane protein SecF n=1 Tax=Thermococcus onnurineus (strain NA1) TaxID=523850 RepID=B6YV05_THEON|nr:protein translocase subunit SecF [Thermococcus onnurineus]ACJ17233.1 protein-export membrane protein SecF [Thermococcus onnurineus NA1]
MSKSKTKDIPTAGEAVRAKKRQKLSFLARMEYKKMITYPMVVFIVALILLAINFPTLGIDLQGGVVVTAYGIDANPDELAKYISDQIGVDVRVESFTGVDTNGVRVYAPVGTDALKIIDVMKVRYPDAEYTHSEVQPTFGKISQQQGIRALIFAFIAMAVVVFLFFRNLVPSLTIIFSALSDMTIAVAMMGIFGIQLTTATIAALLMLIGYTVDSNILLTTKLLKRKEDTIEDAYLAAVSTGFTMSTTTLGALFILWLISTSQTIDNIAIVLIFGLLADFMNTWMLNAGVLRWYLDRNTVRGGNE